MFGNNIGESFGMQDADVSMTLHTGMDAVKLNSDFILGTNFNLVFDALKLSRNIYENIRKFMQFQICVSVNLITLVTAGRVLFYDWPVEPSLVLLLNYLMDTFAACTLATEMPLRNSQILQKTAPYDKLKDPMTPQMWLTIL